MAWDIRQNITASITSKYGKSVMDDKAQALAKALEEYLVRRCLDEDVNYRSVPRFINHVLKNVENFKLEPMLQLLSSDFLEATFNQYCAALVK